MMAKVKVAAVCVLVASMLAMCMVGIAAEGPAATLAGTATEKVNPSTIAADNPGDGEYYVGGRVARAGVYSLSARQVTLKEAVASAGMDSSTALPGARVDLTRRLPGDKERTTIIDLAAIFQGTQPDYYLQPYDLLIVQSNPPAPALAQPTTSPGVQSATTGKINAHESAEILTALAQTMPAQATSQPLSVGRNVMIAGALVTLIGFLLPWFQVDPNAELMRIMGLNPQASVLRQVGASPEIVMQIGQARISANPGIAIRGGDVGNGLGWIALALPLLAVVLPHVAPKLPANNVHAATLALAAGSIITMYLLTSGWRSATYGMGIFVAGYVILWAGAIADRRTAIAASPAVSMA